MALKLDMSKAYDWVKWVFLEDLIATDGVQLEVDWVDYGLC